MALTQYYAVVLGIMAARTRTFRRHLPGYCHGCGCNLVGIVSDTCPECGATVRR